MLNSFLLLIIGKKAPMETLKKSRIMSKNRKHKRNSLFDKTYTEYKFERCNMVTPFFDVYHDKDIITLFRPAKIEEILPFVTKGMENTLTDLLQTDYKSLTIKLELN